MTLQNALGFNHDEKKRSTHKKKKNFKTLAMLKNILRIHLLIAMLVVFVPTTCPLKKTKMNASSYQWLQFKPSINFWKILVKVRILSPVVVIEGLNFIPSLPTDIIKVA